MKNVLILMMLIITNLISAQGYPKIEKDSLGQTIVIMTIEQAQKLDNDSELLAEFKKLGSANDVEKIAYIKIINGNEKVITSQKVEISKLNIVIKDKSNEIDELKKRIDEYIISTTILNNKYSKSQEMVALRDDHIKKLNTKMLIGGIGGSVVILALIAAIIL